MAISRVIKKDTQSPCISIKTDLKKSSQNFTQFEKCDLSVSYVMYGINN